MSDLDDLGKVIAEQTQRVLFDNMAAWEEVLRLHIRPRPAWCPPALWARLVNLVVTQSMQKKDIPSYGPKRIRDGKVDLGEL